MIHPQCWPRSSHQQNPVLLWFRKYFILISVLYYVCVCVECFQFQALFISEDRAGKINPSAAKFTSSSLGAADSSSLQTKDDKLQAPAPRRNFKLFNKGFRIFN